MLPRGCARVLSCALMVLATWLSAVVPEVCADTHGWGEDVFVLTSEENWPPQHHQEWSEPAEELPAAPWITEQCHPEAWTLQWLPPNVIYRSYMAGVHEPRMALVTFFDGDSHAYWDATLGGRAPLVRYGDRDPLRPQGYQLDFYGAAISRLDAEQRQDLEACDYVFGFPLTYGVGDWQFKFGYAHISSHLGDERAIRVPGELARRINYVRDAIVFGTSWFPHPAWRVYWEAGYAFHRSGGARALDTQFGTELSRPGPTGPSGTPYVAINGRLRQEVDFGGDVAVQVGWLRRGELGQTLRFGGHYYNGKSSQFQFYETSEQHLGVGVWYDF